MWLSILIRVLGLILDIQESCDCFLGGFPVGVSAVCVLPLLALRGLLLYTGPQEAPGAPCARAATSTVFLPFLLLGRIRSPLCFSNYLLLSFILHDRDPVSLMLWSSSERSCPFRLCSSVSRCLVNASVAGVLRFLNSRVGLRPVTDFGS